MDKALPVKLLFVCLLLIPRPATISGRVCNEEIRYIDDASGNHVGPVLQGDIGPFLFKNCI